MTLEDSVQLVLPFTVDCWRVTCGGPQFLTHAHKDHCQGLETHGRRIYCTALTRELVINKYPGLSAPEVTWTTLELGQTLHLESDRISTVFGTILHTGDARLQWPQLAGVQKALCEVWERECVEEEERTLDLLILDATFGNEGQELPTREESYSQLSQVLRNALGPRVYLCAEGLGSEDMLSHLHTSLGLKVHLAPPGTPASTPGGHPLQHLHFNGARLHEERYKELDILVRHGVLPATLLSPDPSTHVHIVGGQRFRSLGTQCASEGISAVKLSTQKWCMAGREEGHKRQAPGVVVNTRGSRAVCTVKSKPTSAAVEDGCTFILHSMHSSRSELLTALQTLRPRAVIPHSGPLDMALLPPPDQQAEVLSHVLHQLAAARTQRPVCSVGSPDRACWSSYKVPRPSPRKDCRSPQRPAAAAAATVALHAMDEHLVRDTSCHPRNQTGTAHLDASQGPERVISLLQSSDQAGSPRDPVTPCHRPQVQCSHVAGSAQYSHSTASFGASRGAWSGSGSQGLEEYMSLAVQALETGMSARQYRAAVMKQWFHSSSNRAEAEDGVIPVG